MPEPKTAQQGTSGTTHMAGDDQHCIADGDRWPCSVARNAMDAIDIETFDKCPMGCGRTTNDVYGGPCEQCWDADEGCQVFEGDRLCGAPDNTFGHRRTHD